MNVSTAGLHLHTRRRWVNDAVELLSSMRFAISLLTVIAIACIIGTVLKQNEPFNNYVNQFGPFWFEVFERVSLYTVYSAWWFLLILGFLVLSTSLCIVRNTPKMLKDMRSYRDHLRRTSLRALPHKASFAAALPQEDAAAKASRVLAARGYAVRRRDGEGGLLLAAKAGTWNRLGYIFTHAAIVIICLGGLMDSDLPIRLQILFGGKEPLHTNMAISEVPASGRLGLGNPTFRGNALVPEGGNTETAIVAYKDGVLVQQLPFALRLKRFIVEFYSTGMPKLFASEVVVTDPETGKEFPATIKVNEPLIYKGIAVYQSSFEDGGSKLRLTGYPMVGPRAYTFPMKGEVGGTTALETESRSAGFNIEFTGFRPINVENMSQAGANPEPPKSLRDNINAVLGAGAAPGRDKNLRNVGPSVQYKLRDPSGQAKEFHHYMLPVELDGVEVILAGMRDNPNEAFRYMRIPADQDGSVKEFMHLRAALFDADKRAAAASRFAERALPAMAGDAPPDRRAELQKQLADSTRRSLDTFARGGLQGVAQFLEQAIPKAEQEKAADVFLKLLSGSLWDLWQLAREADGKKAVEPSEKNSRFLQAAMHALSDSFFYTSPIYLQLDSFDHVQASVFQFTRSPGKNIVYLGCLFLVLGVFAMFYIRERRAWLWLQPAQGGGTDVLFAMSATRRTLDFEKEVGQLSGVLEAALQEKQ
jgi:cytochrome c biogenesis protein